MTEKADRERADRKTIGFWLSKSTKDKEMSSKY